MVTAFVLCIAVDNKRGMYLLTLNSVIASWMIVLLISSCVGILIAKTLGPQFHIGSLWVLTLISLIGIVAFVVLLTMPVKTEAAAYAYGGAASVLIILLLMLLPITLMLWFMRLRKRR